MSLFLVSSVMIATAAAAALHELVWLALERLGLAATPDAAPCDDLPSLPARAARAAATAASDGSDEGSSGLAA